MIKKAFSIITVISVLATTSCQTNQPIQNLANNNINQNNFQNTNGYNQNKNYPINNIGQIRKETSINNQINQNFETEKLIEKNKTENIPVNNLINDSVNNSINETIENTVSTSNSSLMKKLGLSNFSYLSNPLTQNISNSNESNESNNINVNQFETLSTDEIRKTDIDQTNLSNYTKNLWKEHLQDISNEGTIQANCKPFYKLAEGDSKGNVLLFHGFTACPQQYEELAERLTNKGYNVFAPLNPGHGKAIISESEKIMDDYQSLPTNKNIDIYEKFATKMGSILKDENGTNVVGGLSLGGVIAAKAILDNQDIYDRGLLMTPFFNVAGVSRVFLPILGTIIPKKRIDWGEICNEQREKGRGGYCNFQISNIFGVRKFGLETLDELNKLKNKIQIVGVEKDGASSNSYIAKAHKEIENSNTCFFEKGSNHSMLSRIDNLNIDMFWLEPLIEQIVEYVETGKNFDEVDKSEHKLNQCRSR